MRPLKLREPVDGVRTVALLVSSSSSYAKALAPLNHRQIETTTDLGNIDETPQSHPLAAAIDGSLPGEAGKPFRAIVIGDGDFASNSFFPFMSNSDLALSMVRWLAREEDETAIATKVRVPPLILLTKAQMQGVFVSSKYCCRFRSS